MTSSTEVFVDMMANGMAVKPAVLADALNAGKDVFLRARQSLGHLPPAPETPAPATLAEAQQLVAEKQQAVLHKEPKQKQKKKEHTPGEAFPGSRVGGANGNSAYWTLVEVSLHVLCSKRRIRFRHVRCTVEHQVDLPSADHICRNTSGMSHGRMF